MIINHNRILCLSPHTDDIECGCGGTISKMIKDGKDVFCVAFSHAQKSIPIGMSKDITLKEMKKSVKILGVKKENIINYDFEVRTFKSIRQEILEILVLLNKEIRPDLIILPSSNDTHQDHQVINNEGFRAFKKQSMIGYEIIWNNLNFNTNIFIELDEFNLNKKIESLNCYISQKVRMFGGAEFFKHLAIVRGNQIGLKYAECFEAIRWIIK